MFDGSNITLEASMKEDEAPSAKPMAMEYYAGQEYERDIKRLIDFNSLFRWHVRGRLMNYLTSHHEIIS